MSKVSQILPVFVLAVIIGAVTSDECLSKTQTWGDVDNPYVFRYCDPTTNTAATVECPEGRGYVNNGTAVGCIPWVQWSDNCVSKVDASKSICDENNSQQPLPSTYPGQYMVCIKPGMAPVAVKCPPGTGFYKGCGYLGCIPFATWRIITGCVNIA